MASTSDESVRSQVSRVMLRVVDKLVAEFPEVPLSVVYAMVGESSVIAARTLPDVTGYGESLERETRAKLRFEHPSSLPEVSTGPSTVATADLSDLSVRLLDLEA